MNVHLPRISWRRFLASRWFPWALVALLLTAFGSATPYGKAIYEERENYRKEVVKLRERVERQTFELAQSEWALKQERNRRTNTKREEVRPDGTRIVETETTQEDTATESAGSSRTETATTETSERASDTTTEDRSKSVSSGGARYGVHLGGRIPLNLEAHSYTLGGSVRLGGLPFWLEGVIDLDGRLYYPQRFGLGLRWEF